MDLKELIWLTHGVELQNALQSLGAGEWSSRDEFEELVDFETSVLMTAIYAEDTFNEYDEKQIQSAILEIVEDHTNIDCYKEQSDKSKRL